MQRTAGKAGHSIEILIKDAKLMICMCIVLEDMKMLEKYKDGKDIVEADLEKINELASIGLIRKDVSFRRRKVIAKTSALGMELIS